MALPSYATQNRGNMMTSREFDLRQHGIAGTRMLDQQRLASGPLMNEQGIPRNRAMRSIIERTEQGENPGQYGTGLFSSVARAYQQSGQMPTTPLSIHEASPLLPEERFGGYVPQQQHDMPMQQQQQLPQQYQAQPMMIPQPQSGSMFNAAMSQLAQPQQQQQQVPIEQQQEEEQMQPWQIYAGHSIAPPPQPFLQGGNILSGGGW